LNIISKQFCIFIKFHWKNILWQFWCDIVRHLVQAAVRTSSVSACRLPYFYGTVSSMLWLMMKWRRLSTRDWWKLTAKCGQIRRILPASWVCISLCITY